MACDHKKALDLASDGAWHEAHELVQPYSDQNSCLIHAYLHRVEGDLSNAGYWYRRADSTMPDNSLDEELQRLYQLIGS